MRTQGRIVTLPLPPSVTASPPLSVKAFVKASGTFKQALIEEEGVRYTVYRDVAGYPTVGVGHLILPEDDLQVGDRVEFAPRMPGELRIGFLAGECRPREHPFGGICYKPEGLRMPRGVQRDSPRIALDPRLPPGPREETESRPVRKRQGMCGLRQLALAKRDRIGQHRAGRHFGKALAKLGKPFAQRHPVPDPGVGKIGAKGRIRERGVLDQLEQYAARMRGDPKGDMKR